MKISFPHKTLAYLISCRRRWFSIYLLIHSFTPFIHSFIYPSIHVFVMIGILRLADTCQPSLRSTHPLVQFQAWRRSHVMSITKVRNPWNFSLTDPYIFTTWFFKHRKNKWILLIALFYVVQLVEALRYKPEGCGFKSRWCHWNFSLS